MSLMKDIKKGQTVRVRTRTGQEYSGEVTSISNDVIVLVPWEYRWDPTEHRIVISEIEALSKKRNQD